jgi:hypothetical protein
MGVTRKLKRQSASKGRTLDYGMVPPLAHAATQPAPPSDSPSPPLVVPPSAPVPAMADDSRRRRAVTPPPEHTTGVRGRYATPVDELLVDRVGPIPASKPPVKRAVKATIRGSGSNRPAIGSVEEVGASSARPPVIGKTPRLAKRGPEIEGAPIDSREAYLLAQIDGTLTIDDLADLVGATPDDTRKMVERLSRLGLVHLS